MENNQYLKTDRDVYIKFEFQVFWGKINVISLSLSGSYHQLEWEPSGLRWKARPLTEKTEGSWTGPSSLFHHLYNGFEFSTSTLQVEVYIEPVPVTRDTHLKQEWAVYTRMRGRRVTQSLTLSWDRSCEWGVHTSRDKELFSDLRMNFYLNRLIFFTCAYVCAGTCVYADACVLACTCLWRPEDTTHLLWDTVSS